MVVFMYHMKRKNQKYMGPTSAELPKIGHLLYFDVSDHLGKPLTLKLWKDLLASYWTGLHINHGQETYGPTGIILGSVVGIKLENDLVVNFRIYQ